MIFMISYKEKHSIGTAMLHIHNYIHTAMHHNKAVLIICMKLSATLDTVDHEILLNHIEKCIKMAGIYLPQVVLFIFEQL